MKRFIVFFLLCLWTAGHAFAQQTRTVTGKVVDETGAPMVGAVIQIVGTDDGTAVDIDGNYTLKNVPENAVLRAYFLGYVPIEKRAAADRIDFAMVPDSEELASVVVTGMQRVDRRVFTGATDQLQAEDIKLDGVGEIARSLEGRSAGVSVQNVSGTFGAAPKIRIRGVRAQSG